MGTWGGGGFENDTAADFAAAVKSPEDIARVFAALPEDPTVPIAADEAERIIAAAECVAAQMGRPAAEIPDALEKRLKAFPGPAAALIETAKMAVSRVLGNSELLDLWSEGDARPFNRAVTSLIDRLNPEKKLKKPRKRRKPAAQQICGFCNKPIELEQLYSFTISQVVEETEFGSAIRRGAWCHLECLNERLHPRHLVQEWKFSPEEIDAESRRIMDLD
jgi:hypothetical protein